MRTIFDPRRGHRVPIVAWSRAMTEETERQLEAVARLPFVVGQVASMADAHVCHGVAVGTVFAAEGALVPSALGGDLGCGVAGYRVSLPASALDRTALAAFVERVRAVVPVGDAIHPRSASPDLPDTLAGLSLSTRRLDRTKEPLARRHLGTLGGGNHFLELDRDADDGLWLLVHSGSRGVGASVAAHHARAAGGRSLAPLAAASEEGCAYLGDLEFALLFARENRRALARAAVGVLEELARSPVTVDDVVDVHHNFVARETWSGREVFVHRKGALHVPDGTRAIVPGSMATASYLVRGLGCERAYDSCSHGAGRLLSRSEARRRIRPEALAREMRRVVWRSDPALVDEAPSAYRDIAEVMEDQRDLVAKVVRLEPMAVIKG